MWSPTAHTSKPLIYKITGVWANHEGSMLLWVMILTLFSAAVAGFGQNLPPSLLARFRWRHGLDIALGFLLFILLTSNPFERVINPPLNGECMNPLLQDPGIANSPAVPLSRLCRFLGGLCLCRRLRSSKAGLIRHGRAGSVPGRWPHGCS